MIFQSTSGQLSEKSVPGRSTQRGMNFFLELAIIAEVFRIPMGIGINQNSCHPEFPIFPTHCTVGPEWKRGGFSFQLGSWKEGTDVSWRKKGGDGCTLDLFSLCSDLCRRDKLLLPHIPPDWDSARQSEKLASLGKRHQFPGMGQKKMISGPAG